MTTRWLGLTLLLIASLGSSACVDSLRSQPAAAKWTTAFWYWSGYGAQPVMARAVPDAVYVHAGTIGANARHRVYGDLPKSLPSAREYWLVFRQEQPGVPDVSVTAALVDTLLDLLADARRRQLRIAGIQLDIDCPTGRLPQYADFLGEIRKGLPAGLELSITALLDWFRDGTAIAAVVKQTDEFVPQFYDVATSSGAANWRAIAAKIDATQWAPKFNRFGKRFRIGVSTFGRARLVPAPDPSPSPAASGYAGLSHLFGDLTPLDIAGNSNFNRQTAHTDAGELVLTYRAARSVRIGYSAFQPGDGVEFILPTPEAIRGAVASARRMGGNCAGVVFFRWPTPDETMVLQPDEALLAAGLAPRQETPAGLDVVDGHCAAVACVDLYLTNAGDLNPQATRYRIHSSKELEYFLPRERVPVRMTGPSELELTLPAYIGESHLLLGRAVTASRAEYHVEREP
jgi:hypothetical protein